MDELIYKIENIVRKCGDELLLANEKNMNIQTKGGIGNIVTEYDKNTQEVLRKELLNLMPQATFIGEEEDIHDSILDKGYTFIVDPIDGTTNFARGLSLSAISVGLLKDGKPYMGICYNPYQKEMFMAQKGKGAFLNNQPIKVSDREIQNGLVILGSGFYYDELRNKTLNTICDFIKVANDFRRLGSAVIDLCSIASGRAEVFFELRLQPWDFAAGLLIVEEAGGKVTTIEGNEVKFDKPSSILASNNKENYLKYINKND